MSYRNGRLWRPTSKWWSAYEALVGEEEGKQLELGEEEEEKKKEEIKKKKVKPVVICPSEQQEQFRVHAWLEKRGIVHHHSPNGGYRDAREGAKFKRLGVSAGFPDLEFPYARKGYHGLYIELKRVDGGKLSERQLWWRDHLQKEGYAWYEAKGFEECIGIVCDYLELEKGISNEQRG